MKNRTQQTILLISTYPYCSHRTGDNSKALLCAIFPTIHYDLLDK